MKKLVFALMGFALGLGALFLVTPEQITSPAKAQQYPRGAQSLGNCPANAKAYRGTGGTYTCGCNSAATGSGSVWGTGTYTDDSSICRAALHAGMISNRGGQVTFSVMGGLASYQGSNRYGVSSSNYGSWQGSYQFGNAVVANPVPPRVAPGPGPNRFGNANVPACPANAKAYRGTGQTVTCDCNSAGMRGGTVWGTSTYTDDSNICRAALHAGMIGNRGGQVTFSVMGGLASYQGSNRNGVSSSNYGSWQGSYQFRRVAGINPIRPGQSPIRPGPNRFGNANVAACPANAKSYRGTGQTVTCACNSTGLRSGTVWGTGTYTDDSNICRAALHAGMISNRGGQVTFSVMGGLASYRGSNRNGVSSTNYGSWQGSFRFGNAVSTSPVLPRNNSGPRWGNIRPSNYPACPANAQARRGQNGAGFTCSCSASDVANGNAWGWITYTDDSKICRAALQSGFVGAQGGNVTVTIVAGQSSYQSQTNNGVTSSNYGSYGGSYQLSAAR